MALDVPRPKDAPAKAWRGGQAPAEPLIWWIDQPDTEAAMRMPRSSWPKYLREQLDSRYGRNGRGRLWAAKEFGQVQVDDGVTWPRHLAEECAGIVIHAVDLKHLRRFPGIVTDLRLERVSREAMAATGRGRPCP